MKILYALYQALAKKQEIHEWLLKTYQLDEYRNRKIKRLRGDKARKRRDYQN